MIVRLETVSISAASLRVRKRPKEGADLVGLGIIAFIDFTVLGAENQEISSRKCFPDSALTCRDEPQNDEIKLNR